MNTLFFKLLEFGLVKRNYFLNIFVDVHYLCHHYKCTYTIIYSNDFVSTETQSDFQFLSIVSE